MLLAAMMRNRTVTWPQLSRSQLSKRFVEFAAKEYSVNHSSGAGVVLVHGPHIALPKFDSAEPGRGCWT